MSQPVEELTWMELTINPSAFFAGWVRCISVFQDDLSPFQSRQRICSNEEKMHLHILTNSETGLNIYTTLSHGRDRVKVWTLRGKKMTIKMHFNNFFFQLLSERNLNPEIRLQPKSPIHAVRGVRPACDCLQKLSSSHSKPMQNKETCAHLHNLFIPTFHLLYCTTLISNRLAVHSLATSH